MPRKTRDTFPRKSTKAEGKRQKKEVDARRKNPIKKRKSDIKRIIRKRGTQFMKPVVRSGVQIFHERDEKRTWLIQDLEDAGKSMRRWGGRPTEKIEENRERYEEDRADFEMEISRAIRAGLVDHPLVREWIATQRSFGDWDALRKFKRQRLERSVRRTISKEYFWIIYKAIDLREEGKGLHEIRNNLIGRLRRNDVESWFDFRREEQLALATHLRGLTRQGFHQLLKRLAPWLITPDN